MIDHNIGVAESQNYIIKDIDADYFWGGIKAGL